MKVLQDLGQGELEYEKKGQDSSTLQDEREFSALRPPVVLGFVSPGLFLLLVR